MLALPLPFPSHALIAILQLSWKGVVLAGGIFSMALQQWLWIAYTPEDGNIWSSCVLTLHDTGAITFDGIETGGKWTYTSTSTANTAVAVSYDEHPDTDASRCRGKEKRCDVYEWMRCDRFL